MAPLRATTRIDVRIVMDLLRVVRVCLGCLFRVLTSVVHEDVLEKEDVGLCV
jgi:hypothetical protein